MEEVCEYGPHVGRVSSHALSRWSRSPCCGGFISWFVLSGGISWGFFSFSLLGMHKADLLKTTHSWPIPEDINDLPSKIENDVLLRRCSLAKRPKSPRNLNRAHWTVTFRIRCTSGTVVPVPTSSSAEQQQHSSSSSSSSKQPTG